MDSTEERLFEIWPGLVKLQAQAAVEAAVAAQDSSDHDVIKRALDELAFVDTPEVLADIASEGLAAELAELIPGAVDDEGMLILSNEHETLLERARQRQGMLRKRLAAL